MESKFLYSDVCSQAMSITVVLIYYCYYFIFFAVGTYKIKRKADIDTIIPAALDLGYRLFDSAACYANESLIGEILKEALPAKGIDRSEIFITSKLQPADQGYDAAWAAIRKSLSNLQLSYLDLYLIHWPGAAGKAPTSEANKKLRQGSWKALCEAYHQGLLRAIGVSNYTVHHLQEFDELCHANSGILLPMVNQIELHPAWWPEEDVTWCESRGIFVQAYSSLGTNILLAEPFLTHFPSLTSLSLKYTNGDVSLLLLHWAMQHGWGVLPKTTTLSRLESNLMATQVACLDAEEMESIDAIHTLLSDNAELCRLCGLKNPSKICWNPETIQ